MKYRPKHIAEYILLRSVAFVVCVLPYRAALGLGWGVGALAFFGFGFRRNKVLKRMRSVFGERYSEKEYRRMAWISCRNMVFSAIEVIRVPRVTREWCNSIFEYGESLEILKRYLAETEKGAIIALPHTGSWDLGGIAYSLNDVPTVIIPGRQSNPLANDYFDRVRRDRGINAFPRGDAGSTRKIMHAVRKGGVLAIMPDARMRTPGIEMPLLGGTANLGAGMATFARIAGVPIFPVMVTREGWTRHRIRPFPTVEPDMSLDKQADVQRMTAIVLKEFDREIQADPEQWFWFNSRWVLDPVAEPKKDSDDSDQ